MTTETAAVDVKVPDIGDFDSVPVIEILVAVGDQVEPETPLVSLESDKATMDVPSPIAGKVSEIVVKIGDKVSEGDVIVRVEADASSASTEASSDDGPAADPRQAKGSSAAPSSETSDASATGPVLSATPSPAPDVVPPADTLRTPVSDGGTTSGAASTSSGTVYASPSVRRLARELSIDLATVTGTGRKGRILSGDVQAATKVAAAASAVPSNGSAAGGGAGLNLAPWPNVNFERFGEVERVPLTRIQKLSGPNLARNWVMIPHVTQFDEADMTDLEAWRKQINSELPKDAAPVTLLAFLIRASVAVLKEMPKFNSALDGEELVLRKYYNIGFAADTPTGLVVPVIRDADKKGIVEIAAELGVLAGKARAGQLSPTDISGATFTISSLGGIGGTAFTPIINAPEVAILGVSRSQIKPVWDKPSESFKPRMMLPLSLSYDHRVIDGAAAARFTVALCKIVTDLRRVLL